MDKSREKVKQELKELFVANLSLGDIKPEDIGDDMALFGDEKDSLGLDSLDAVEIVVILQRNFDVEIDDLQENKEILSTVETVTDYISENAV